MNFQDVVLDYLFITFIIATYMHTVSKTLDVTPHNISTPSPFFGFICHFDCKKETQSMSWHFVLCPAKRSKLVNLEGIVGLDYED